MMEKMDRSLVAMRKEKEPRELGKKLKGVVGDCVVS